MKKIIFGLSLILSGLNLFSQLPAPFEVNEVPVFDNGIERMLVEKIDASAVGTDMVTYRVFVDMADGYAYQLTTGTSEVGDMSVTTSGTWYNTAVGSSFGDQILDALIGAGFPTLIYDSYVTSGGSTNTRIAVPFSENSAGYVAGIPSPTVTTPGLNLTMFGTANSTVDFVTDNGTFAVDPASVSGGAVGPNASNILMIGQFTTDGDFEFDLNIQMFNFTTSTFATATGIQYSSMPNQAPNGALVAPVNGTAFDKDAVVSIGVHASDPDGSVSQVEFFVNGSSIGIDNTSNGQTDPSLPTHDITWTASGASASIYAVVTDNGNATATTNTVNITINDPCPIVVAMTAPAAGTYDLNDITLTADASDCDEPITSVAFMVNSTVVSTDTDGSNGWSTVYSPATGTVNINARATNNVGANAVSPAISVTFANAAPTVSVTAPVTPFSLEIGHDTTFVATAQDVDGSVVRVEFLVNGSVVATDNDGINGFSFDFTGNSMGTYSVVARARDNNNAQTSSPTITFSVVAPAGGPAYIIENVEEFCSSSEMLCMPVSTTRPVANVIGYDVEMHYDANNVTPTGVVTVYENLIASSDWVSYNYNVVGDSIIRISLYFNGTAPANANFNGEGSVFCVEFARNYSFGNDDQTTFEIPVISESYADFVLDQSAISGTYSTIAESEFTGSLSFWSDNSPIRYQAGVNLITNIFGDINPSEIVNPDANGHFVFNIANGTSITIDRDVEATTDVQSVINGYDAYLTSRVTVEDANLRPNVYQIIAMDVNRDGRVAAGDITQISQRAVAQLNEFAQDWVFVPLSTILSDASYHISANYPAYDGIGFSRLHVPSVNDLLALPIENAGECPIIGTENYKGIFLGDVDGSYASLPESTTLKSAKIESSEIVIDLGTNSVYASSQNEVNAVDFQIILDSKISNVHVQAVEGLVVTSNLVGNKLAVSSYATKQLADDQALMSLDFESSSAVDTDDLSVVLSLINGQPVSASVKGASQVSSLPDNINSEVMVYPNPASSELFISADFDAVVSIYNTTGAMVMSKEIKSGLTTIDVDGLDSGLYIVKLLGESRLETISIVIK